MDEVVWKVGRLQAPDIPGRLPSAQGGAGPSGCQTWKRRKPHPARADRSKPLSPPIAFSSGSLRTGWLPFHGKRALGRETAVASSGGPPLEGPPLHYDGLPVRRQRPPHPTRVRAPSPAPPNKARPRRCPGNPPRSRRALGPGASVPLSLRIPRGPTQTFPRSRHRRRSPPAEGEKGALLGELAGL